MNGDKLDFCPKCGSMILNGTKCSMCGYNINGFDLNDLQIRTPEEFIYDKSEFEGNYDKLLDLILNKDHVYYTEEDILKNYKEIIDIANNNLINKEKKIIQKEFVSELHSCGNFIDMGRRQFFKSKFNKDYFNYYADLKFDRQINQFNKDFIEKRKKEIKIEFQKDLNSHDFITDENIKEFELKYNTNYCDFFDELKMKNEIGKFNRKYSFDTINSLRRKYNILNSPIPEEMLSELKSINSDVDWDIIVRDYNKPFFKNKFNPYKTTDGVYYLYDYIVKDNWKYDDPDKVKISKKILKYKDGIRKEVTRFTNDLMHFIEKFAKFDLDSNTKQIFLVSVPSSTQARDKNSPIKKSINIIVRRYENGQLNLYDDQKIVDLSGLLYRKSDITASHIKRQTYEVHMKTIGLNRNELKDYDDGIFLIMDDITTTGNVLNACTDILIKNGVPSEKIYKLVIAATG